MCILYLLIICTYQGRATSAIGAILVVTMYIHQLGILWFVDLFRGNFQVHIPIEKGTNLTLLPNWNFIESQTSLNIAISQSKLPGFAMPTCN